MSTKYKTQWTAQFYVAAELIRRGYLVSLTLGNAPVCDLLVQSISGDQFTIDVKGLSTKNFWLCQNRPLVAKHYFILVYIPQDFRVPEYFILSSDELMRKREEHKQSVIRRGANYREQLGGINWTTAFEYKDKWDCLPQ